VRPDEGGGVVLVLVPALVVLMILGLVGVMFIAAVLSRASAADACVSSPPISAVASPASSTSEPLPAPVASAVDIDSPTLERINALRPLYEQAAADTDVAWPVLAAIDYRENTNDPNKSALSGEDIGTANYDDKSVVTSSKLDSLQRASEHLRSMASSVYGVTVTSATTDEDLRLALLAYNRGSRYKWAGVGADQSVYVMNQFDEAHRDMVWADIQPGAGNPANEGEPLRGRQEVGRYGAFTLFVRLGGASGTPCRPGLSGDASQLLTNPNVIFSRDSQQADLEAGRIDPRIIGVLAWMARDHVITITSLRADHSPCAGGSSNERADGSCVAGLSNHGFGRAADVSVLDGEHVSASSGIARTVVDAILASDGQLGLTELGQPFYARSIGQVYVFTEGHGDHIHVGIDADAAIVPGAPGTTASGAGQATDGVPAGWSEVDDCNGTDSHWGTTNPNNRTIYYCSASINGSGGEVSKWVYVRAHERCHARAFEGLEAFTYTDEQAADRCAAAHGADTSWSPY
ncbi:MAG: hypothetical protein QOE58_2619, partial [Actinomycetota bacterium]|nr:hypothetical protein [Actinomycetota bacterium]